MHVYTHEEHKRTERERERHVQMPRDGNHAYM